MSNIRRTLAIKVQTPGGDNPLRMQLVGKGPFFRGIAVSGLALVGQGGTAPYAFSIIAGGDSNGGVNGLTLNTDGTFSGAGDESGRFVFVAEVSDSAGSTFTHSFSITFLAQLFVVHGTPTPGEIGLAYSYQFVVKDATGTVLTSGYSLSAGNLPAGLALTPAGLLHNTPTAPDGISYFTITATDGVDSIDIPCVMTVYAELSGSYLEDRDPPAGWGGGAGTWLPAMTRLQDWFAHLVITGGIGPYSIVPSAVNPPPTGIKVVQQQRLVYGRTSDAAVPDPVLMSVLITDALGGIFTLQRAVQIIDSPNGRIMPQRNGVDLPGGNGAVNYDFVEGSGVSIVASNDGETARFEFSAIHGVGNVVETINGIGPDSSGELPIAGIGVDSNGDLFVIPTGTSGVTSINGATGVVTETSSDGSLGHVDTAGAGGNIDWTARLLAKLVTVAALPTNTYANGTAGIGATLTGSATGTLTVDGVLVALNDFVLVTQEASGLKCGLYKCTTAGAVGVAYVLTRSDRMDSTGKYVGAQVFITRGATGSIRVYACSNQTAPTVGTTAITFNAITFSSGVNGTFSNMSATILNGIVIAAANGSATTDIHVFSATGAGTWTKPPNAKVTQIFCLGAGGGGGGGVRSGGNNRVGAGGGGGGCGATITVDSSILGATEAVTVGAGGTGAAAKNGDAPGNNGSAGTDTSFGTWLTGYGGGAGFGASGTAAGGGGGGGAGSRGGDATTAAGTAGRVGGIIGSVNNPASISNNLGPFGGGGGGSASSNTAGGPGGEAVFGGGGGGAGGGVAAAHVGGAGGSTVGAPAVVAGGTIGGANVTGGNGGPGVTPATSAMSGSGGGGGGAAASGTGAGGTGGNGGRGAGGGGGGSTGSATAGITGGAGGNGGDGYCVVITQCSI
jgi:hypothetical protein